MNISAEFPDEIAYWELRFDRRGERHFRAFVLITNALNGLGRGPTPEAAIAAALANIRRPAKLNLEINL